MGVFQLQTGLHLVVGTPGEATWFAMLLLIVLFAAFMTSAATSLDKGIKILSNVNMALAILLLPLRAGWSGRHRSCSAA